jgi:ribonuclease-3
LAHRSWCAEHTGQEPNERLEFLGDAVLGLIVTDFLYRSYPDFPEGELAKVRAAVVNATSLASVAREVHLGNALLLGKGEDSSGGRLKPSILADAMEALIGAVYLDAGYGVADEIVLRLLGGRIQEAVKGPGDDDYKTRLQELCAQTYDELPLYRVTDRGPDHAKVFDAEVVIAGRPRGRGEGRSKKQAEQMAARYAWYALEAEGVTALASAGAGETTDEMPVPCGGDGGVAGGGAEEGVATVPALSHGVTAKGEPAKVEMAEVEMAEVETVEMVGAREGTGSLLPIAVPPAGAPQAGPPAAVPPAAV